MPISTDTTSKNIHLLRLGFCACVLFLVLLFCGGCSFHKEKEYTGYYVFCPDANEWDLKNIRLSSGNGMISSMNF
mgnify:CR=1 FL=1